MTLWKRCLFGTFVPDCPFSVWASPMGQGSIKRKMGLLNRTRIVVPLVHLNIPIEAANAALFVQNGQNTHESFGQML
jgi:hypothetical protein